MKRLIVTCSVLFLFALAPAVAGVVIEMGSIESDASASGDTIYAQDGMLRMNPSTADGKMSMIFRDDTLWLTDHGEKKCRTLDREGLEELSAQLDGAMKEIEAQLAQMPPEQREMMKKMMKDRMPMMAGDDAPRKIETGGAEQVGDYACTVKTLYSGEDKVWEVCAASGDLTEQVAEAKQAFQAMSAFTSDLQGVAKKGPLSGMLDTPFNDMNDIEGFPVRVRTYSDGRIVSESTLKSIKREDLDAALFTAPDGYKVEDLTMQIKRGGR